MEHSTVLGRGARTNQSGRNLPQGSVLPIPVNQRGITRPTSEGDHGTNRVASTGQPNRDISASQRARLTLTLHRSRKSWKEVSEFDWSEGVA